MLVSASPLDLLQLYHIQLRDRDIEINRKFENHITNRVRNQSRCCPLLDELLLEGSSRVVNNQQTELSRAFSVCDAFRRPRTAANPPFLRHNFTPDDAMPQLLLQRPKLHQRSQQRRRPRPSPKPKPRLRL